jgi:rhamnosyltransferase
MSSTFSIASVTVCYKAAKELPKHIDSLLSQTRSLQEIVVVDNGSNDGTSVILQELSKHITYINLGQNLGVGGGYSAGLSYAAGKQRHDWIWLLDHDSIPDRDATKNLEDAVRILGDEMSKVGMLVSIGVHSETGAKYFPLFWQNGFVKPTEDVVKRPIWFADFAMSSGSLVRREVVDTIGLPRADFFMDGVDFEYCLRMRGAGYKIAVVTSSRLSHAMGNPRAVRIFGFRKVRGDHPPWRHYYVARNVVYVGWWLYPNRTVKLYLLGYLAKHAFAVLLFDPQKLSSLKKILQGFLDGRRARLGIRFSPPANVL